MERILVSGAGSIGMRHLRNLQLLGINDLAISDPSADQLNKVKDELNIETFSDFTEAINAFKPTIVFICGPTMVHVPQALEAAKAGAHLFIEKPLSHTNEGIDELKKEVADRNLVCMVGCNMRFHPGPAMVKKLLSEGRIGPVIEAEVYTGSYLPNWRPHMDYRDSYSASRGQGGVTLDCIHEIDLALWYFGPAEVLGASIISAASIDLPDIDGTADIDLIHDSKTKSSVHLSFTEPDYKRSCSITGENGYINWDFNEKKVEVKDPNGETTDAFPEPEGWEVNNMYVDEIKYFLNCVKEKKTPQGDLDEAQAALIIAFKARNEAKMSDK